MERDSGELVAAVKAGRAGPFICLREILNGRLEEVGFAALPLEPARDEPRPALSAPAWPRDGEHCCSRHPALVVRFVVARVG